MLDRPRNGAPDVADLAVNDQQPLVLIMTYELWCRSFDKITVELRVASMGDHSIRVQRELAAGVLPDQLQQAESRLLATFVLAYHQRLGHQRGQHIHNLDLIEAAPAHRSECQPTSA